MMKLLDISISRTKAAPKPTQGVRRKFEDGTVEVEFSNGRRVRKTPFHCIACGVERVEHGLNVRSAKLARVQLCEECYQAEQEERAAVLSAERAARRLLGETPAQRRYVALVLATPDWRDRLAIKEIYARAAELTAHTGILHEVDHIYPIQSEYGCGLHVHQNLQILNKRQNRSKKNKFPVHDSPALKLGLAMGREITPNQAGS